MKYDDDDAHLIKPLYGRFALLIGKKFSVTIVGCPVGYSLYLSTYGYSEQLKCSRD